MSGRTLADTPFLEMLPESLRSDEDMIALAQAIDIMFFLGDVEAGNVLIWSRIDGMEEPLLSNLAYQLHLEGYEGWQMAETLEQKRRLVKEAIKLHFYKGTRYALERVFEVLEMRGKVTEWWEAPSDPEFDPYEFDIEIQANRAIDGNFEQDVLNLIDALKNKRSHLRRGALCITASGKTPFIGAATLCGARITMRPFMVTDAEARMRAPHIGAAAICVARVVVYPVEND